MMDQDSRQHLWFGFSPQSTRGFSKKSTDLEKLGHLSPQNVRQHSDIFIADRFVRELVRQSDRGAAQTFSNSVFSNSNGSDTKKGEGAESKFTVKSHANNLLNITENYTINMSPQTSYKMLDKGKSNSKRRLVKPHKQEQNQREITLSLLKEYQRLKKVQ